MTLTGQGRGHVREKTYSKVPSGLKQALAFPRKFLFLFNNIAYDISKKTVRLTAKLWELAGLLIIKQFILYGRFSYRDQVLMLR